MAIIPAGNDGGPWAYTDDIYKEQMKQSGLYQQMAMQAAQQHLGAIQKNQLAQQRQAALDRRAAMKASQGGGEVFTPEETAALSRRELFYAKGANPPDPNDLNATGPKGTPIRPIKNKRGMIDGWLLAPNKEAAPAGPQFKQGKKVDAPSAAAAPTEKKYTPKIDPATGKVIRGEPVEE